MANCFCLKWRPDVVKVLDFRHCNLLFVPEEVFEFEETLQELFLDSNDIRDLPRPLFHCQYLKKLGASDNQLFSVPPAIGGLTNLRELDLSKNGILELPDRIAGCRELDLLEISVNPLGKLPDGFTQLINLTQLYLNDILLDYLPANIGRLIKLKVLELRENHLKALPRSIGRMTELERLDLGQNCFQEVPDVIGSLSSLQEFWIDANKVKDIPSSIGSLSKLFYFDASQNRIEELPETISGWESIKDIYLSKNFIQRLPERIGQLSTLSTLRVDNNQISSLPYSIGGLVSLEELILNANDLEELPPSIGLLRRLRHLNIDDNMLMSLPPEMGSCSKISLLSLRGNYLETLPDEIGRISSLTVANLSNNRLKNLPYNFTKLKNLQALWLSENQSKPLIPLQSEAQEEGSGKLVLTCFLLPQQPLEDIEYDDGDSDSFHASVWSQQRRQRMVIAFDVADSEPESSPQGRRHAYPKESFRPRYRGGPFSNETVLPKYSSQETSQAKHERVRGRREYADDASVASSTRRSRPLSPDSSVISANHFLFKADKEKRARDKERLRKSSSKHTKDEDLQVQWGLPEMTSFTKVKARKKRGSRNTRVIIKDRSAHSDTEVLDSHPMKVRTPQSERKRLSQQEMEEADREVAQLTDALRRAFVPEREHQTDTELFNENDMPDVVFQPNSSKNNLFIQSASMEFTPMSNLNQDVGSHHVQNGIISVGASMESPSRSIASHTIGSSVKRNTTHSLSFGSVGGASNRMSPANSDGASNNRLTPDGHGTTSNGRIPQRTPQTNSKSRSPQKSISMTKRRSSGISDSLIRDVPPPMQYHNLTQHQGRDSGISGVSVQSGPITDPELDGIYQMRYQRANTGPQGGYDAEEPSDPLRGDSRGREGYHGGQNGSVRGTDWYHDGQGGSQNDGEHNIAYDNRTGPNGSLEHDSYAGETSRNSGRFIGDGGSREEQRWEYNVESEAAKRLHEERSMVARDSNQWGRDDTSTFTSAEGMDTESLVNMSRSQPRVWGGARGLTRTDGHRHNQRSSQGTSPWDPKESPPRPKSDELRTSVPASGDYSNQLREASSRLLPQARSQPYTGTPSLSYQDQPSAFNESDGRGARRHLRFSSENQTIINRSKLISQSQTHPGNGCTDIPHSERSSLSNRTRSYADSSGMFNYGESTLNEQTKSLSFHERTKRTSAAAAVPESCLETSHGGCEKNVSQNYQERPVDVPPEFIAADSRQQRLSQVPTPSVQQFQSLRPSHYSTPFNHNHHVSHVYSGRQRLSRSLPSNPHDYSREFAGVPHNNHSIVSGRDSGRDSGVMWALPIDVNDDGENYVTDVNSNVNKETSGQENGSGPREKESGRWSERGGGNRNNLATTTYQRDVPPDYARLANETSSVRGNINERNWKSHLVDHLQKREQERSTVFQHPSTFSPPLYHQALRNSSMRPPSVTRRMLPTPPPVVANATEDIRRVTPPGSSGSSTNDSFSKTAPPRFTARNTQHGDQGKSNPPVYQSTPLTQGRTPPDGDKGHWL